MSKEYYYSEIFKSIQGEGHYTGVPTVWFRSWGCNLNCNGFGQTNPYDQTTWELPHETIKVEEYSTMEELPVFSKGCDSSYSWSKKYKHLAHKDNASNIARKIIQLMETESNKDGLFRHPKSKQWTHLAFTGGEPMLAQTAIIDIMNGFFGFNNYPDHITIETNGSILPRQEFNDFFLNEWRIKELFWSCSPKLSTSGEKWNDTILPGVLGSMNKISAHGQLKYVCDGTKRCWDEIEMATQIYRNEGVQWPVWIMPVGATEEGQKKLAGRIADEAVDRGYNVSARVHVYLFGNVIGK